MDASHGAPSLVTHDGNVKNTQKRPRPILSCLQCKRKKLKCDRQNPCIQCLKNGRSTQCSYSDFSSSAPSGRTPDVTESGRPTKIARPTLGDEHRGHVALPSPISTQPSAAVVKVGVIEDLQDRVQKLEQRLTRQSRASTFPGDADTDDGSQAKPFNVNLRGVLHLKGSSARYHGENQKGALLRHFQEARAFMEALDSDFGGPNIVSLRKDLTSLRKLLPKQSKHMVGEDFHDTATLLERMLQLLPSRPSCDKLVSIYMDNFENELRVLHLPSFSAELDQFWQAQESRSSTFRDVVPQLVCVLAVATSLDGADIVANETSNGYQTVLTYCDLVAKWLDTLKAKQRLKYSTLQTQTLLLMARQCTIEHVKEMWNATGSLVRSAMSIGLHRDPSEALQIPTFWAEMRRRLWMTIVEMDLQISLTYGMPTMVCPNDFTCGIPANVNDSDISEKMAGPTQSRSLVEWTDCLSQVVLAKSLRERLEGARLLSNIENGLDYDQVLGYAKRLEGVLQDLPPPLKFDHTPNEESQKPGRLLARVIFDIHIRRAILNLCSPFVQVEPDHADFSEARKVFIRSSLVILCYQDIFDPNFADLDIVPSPKYWDFFHLCCGYDMMHASLGVCLEIKRLSSNPRSLDSTPNGSGRLPSQAGRVAPMTTIWSKASLTKTVEDIIDPLMRRLGRFGSNAKDLLCLSVVLNSVRTNQSPERKEVLMETGIRELINAGQQHLQRMRSNGTEGYDPDLGTSQLIPLSHTASHNPSISSEFDLSSLFAADFDFLQMDFSFADDWRLDQAWF